MEKSWRELFAKVISLKLEVTHRVFSRSKNCFLPRIDANAEAHQGIALAKMGKMIDFQFMMLDDRDMSALRSAANRISKSVLLPEL